MAVGCLKVKPTALTRMSTHPEFVEHGARGGHLIGMAVANIGRVAEGAAAGGFYGGADLFDVKDAATSGDHVGSLLGEAEGDGIVDTRGGSDDDGDAIREIEASGHLVGGSELCSSSFGFAQRSLGTRGVQPGRPGS